MIATPLCRNVTAGVWSPTGRHFAAVGENGAADIYDARGVLLRQIRRTPVLTMRRSAEQGASALAWLSDDGMRLLALHMNGGIWEADLSRGTWKPMHETSSGRAPVVDGVLAVSNDGACAALANCRPPIR